MFTYATQAEQSKPENIHAHTHCQPMLTSNKYRQNLNIYTHKRLLHLILFNIIYTNRLNNMTGPNVQSCIQCPDGKYMQDPEDPNAICQQCPKSARCPNRGPPIFDNSAIEGNLVLDGDPNDLDAIIASLAASLGVDLASLVLGKISSSRRAALQISFELFAGKAELEELSAFLSSPNLMDALAANLAQQNITASIGITSTIRLAEKRDGEVWMSQGGVYGTRGCVHVCVRVCVQVLTVVIRWEHWAEADTQVV